MSIILKQFAGSSITPEDDARLYSFITQCKSGIVEGVEITLLGANQLKVSSGWGICQGRMFEVLEETINAQLSTSGELNGRLVLNIDTSSDTPATFVTQAAETLPALIQEDINGSGIVYQMPLAEYKITELEASSLKNTSNRLPYSEGVTVYIHTDSALTGSGTNGKFKATVTGTYTAFTIDGVSYAVKAGGETEIELTSGVWYSFILDTGAKTINFKAGGGVSNSKLALATATEADVLVDKTFYAGDKTLKTGTAFNAENIRNYLYKDGVFNVPFSTYDLYSHIAISVINENNVLTITGGMESKFMTPEPVDVTDYDYICFKFDSYYTDRTVDKDGMREYVFLSQRTGDSDTWAESDFVNNASISWKFKEGYVVVSTVDLTGNYYIGFYANAGAKYNINAVVSEIFLGNLADNETIDFALATATEIDVLSGKTFYSKNKTLKTGIATEIDYRTFFDKCETFIKYKWNENGTLEGDNGTFARTDSRGVFTAKVDCIVEAFYSFTFQTVSESTIFGSTGCTILEKIEDNVNTRKYIINVPAGETVTLWAIGNSYSSWKMKVSTMRK